MSAMSAMSAIPSRSFLAAFLPVVQSSLFPHAPSRTESLVRRVPLLQRLRSSLLPAAFLPIPSLIETIWEGILKAVPKKKTSHSKKRHRQMAGKALKDVTSLNKCSGCGRLKRAHLLCPYCVQSIRQWVGNGFKTSSEIAAQKEKDFQILNEKLRSLGQEPLKAPKKKEEKRS